MTLAYWCVLVAGVLPYFAVLPAKQGVDNRYPRDAHAAQSGLQKRAYGAHLNGLEAFPLFAAGVVLGYQFGSSPAWLDGLSVAFVLARAIYTWAYLSDKSGLRSAVWAIGFAIVMAIFSLPVFS